MRVFVIGGTGFIGPHVVRALGRAGHDVSVFHRGSSNPELPSTVRHVLGDRHDLPSALSRIERPDVVIDCILSSAGQARALMDAFGGVAGRVAAVSSIDVYRACGVLHGTEPGALEPVPLTEDSPLRTQPPYSRDALARVRKSYSWIDDEYDKVPVEREVLSRPELPGTVVRLPMVYGPGDPLHRLFPILKRIDDGRPAILIEESIARWRGPRAYVEDCGAAIALAAASDRAVGRVYHVAQRENFSELEWTEHVARVCGWNGRVVAVPADRAPAHLKMPYNAAQHWAVDSARIRNELGYREGISLDESLRRTIAWERANPPGEIDLRQFDYAAEDEALALRYRTV